VFTADIAEETDLAPSRDGAAPADTWTHFFEPAHDLIRPALPRN
jgi:hypothetical protein